MKTSKRKYVLASLAELRRLFQHAPLREQLAPGAAEYLAQRTLDMKSPGRSGYSDGELDKIVTAARSDVAAIERRLRHGEELLRKWRTDRESLSPADRDLGARLSGIAESGVVPRQVGDGVLGAQQRTALARHLFVTRADLEPLVVLMIAMSGRNSETVKELPADHQVVGQRAVELTAIKRRRGTRGWFDAVSWEIGPEHRRMHTPGGVYLLMHELMRRSRQVSGSSSVWSVWRNAVKVADRAQSAEHHDPFARALEGMGLWLSRWAATHALTVDQVTSDSRAVSLPVNLGRIRTSVEVRRTRAVGGHLPSAAVSNTTPVLFSNYLRGNATVKDWAEGVLGEAVAEAETAALAAHQAILRTSGEQPLRVNLPTLAAESAVDGAWAACSDPQHRPTTGRACRSVSFLDCFHCGNCVITDSHLPAITSLMGALADRRTELSEADWWARYGPAWAAIRHEVYPKFTPEQLRRATQDAPADAMLDLTEAPWDRP
ncbi:hypothetical protein [Kribbella catacumbae]|uniref:hypothetical protein n=1 Tax=Kribbella catacumbae TaxID=460086 RepID=UPI000476D45F|nr:hypothetical protein [Kribbella catacumbae]